MNYLVSDFMIRIKNAALAKRREVSLPFSRLNQAIGNVLVKEGYLIELKEEKLKKGVLVAKLAFAQRRPILTDVTVVSKPSLRVYTPTRQLRTRRNKGVRTIIVSTSKGVMTDEQARKLRIGGEVLAEIW